MCKFLHKKINLILKRFINNTEKWNTIFENVVYNFMVQLIFCTHCYHDYGGYQKFIIK